MAELIMRGVGGARGPLRQPTDFRLKLALLFLIAVPMATALCAVMVGALSFTNAKHEFLADWITYTAALWSLFGEVAGGRIAAAVGYHWTELVGRLLELLVPFACFMFCGITAAILYPPNGAFTLGACAVVFVIMGFIGFIRRMIAR